MTDSNRSHAGAAGGGVVYGLGFIGALVYFIQSATSLLGRLLRCLPGAGVARIPRLRVDALAEAVGEHMISRSRRPRTAPIEDRAD